MPKGLGLSLTDASITNQAVVTLRHTYITAVWLRVSESRPAARGPTSRCGDRAEALSADPDVFKEPTRKRRRSDRGQRFRAFPSAEQSALKEYEKLESRTRRVLSSTYQKLIQSVFLDDSIPSGVKYLINRLLALIEQPSLDPIYIGLFGSTGAGKSSLINAIIQQEMFLPVSGESSCTSCIVQVSSGCREQYEARIHLLSDQEWKEELRQLTRFLHGTEEPGGEEEEEEAWGRDDAAEDARCKLQALYGHGAERRSYKELLRAKPKEKVPASRVITLKAEEAGELSLKLDPYIRTRPTGWEGQRVETETETQLWPLIKYVEVTLPKSELIPEGVVLVDIPGTGDFNSKRDEMWKKTIDKCSVIWVVSDIERVSGGRAHEALLHESIKACQRGFCSDVALVVTKTDKLHLPEYLSAGLFHSRSRSPSVCPPGKAGTEGSRCPELCSRGAPAGLLQTQAKLPADSKALDASPLVYTVSAQEYWQRALLSEEETEIPKLRETIRKRLLDQKRRRVTTYVTEAFGLLLLTDSFSSADTPPSEHSHLSCLRRFVDEEVQRLERAVDQCFSHLQQPLQDGVRLARASYRRILGACLARSRGNQGFHQTLKAVCLKNGVYASRTLARIDLNEALTQPIYDQIDPVFGGIFRAGKPTGLALMPHIDAFKHSLQEKMTEIGIRNGWKDDRCKKSFLIQEVSAILGGLEGHILRRKRRLYESLATSIQSDLKACYEEAAQVTGRKACERMKDILRRGVDRQVAEGMFERARERMQHQCLQLKSGLSERVKSSVASMLTLAAAPADGLYKDLAGNVARVAALDRTGHGREQQPGLTDEEKAPADRCDLRTARARARSPATSEADTQVAVCSGPFPARCRREAQGLASGMDSKAMYLHAVSDRDASSVFEEPFDGRSLSKLNLCDDGECLLGWPWVPARPGPSPPCTGSCVWPSCPERPFPRVCIFTHLSEPCMLHNEPGAAEAPGFTGLGRRGPELEEVSSCCPQSEAESGKGIRANQHVATLPGHP
ncbi:Nuclear GTPase SLIP-GC [Galemys pyrenaicus]|uniref:Nuclear GTPase SLIP-GC n=1 Tax=Galemys pyrenaicus TaxID=202257 RepID=A0A8J6DE01_GALPY|nr:Nuclear GTPase SLIP-GC [Galemys pyrenaicus]